jgi:ABC-type phosphate transport system substrate-binding protein
MTMQRRLLYSATILWLAVSSPAIPRAEDNVVAVVSAKSPVTALNTVQVADIFLGKTSRFPDGTQAVPIDQNEDSPARDRFYAQFTGKSPAQVKAHWSKIIFTGRGQPPRQASTGLEARRMVAENPNAIGYIDPALVDNSVRVLASGAPP